MRLISLFCGFLLILIFTASSSGQVFSFGGRYATGNNPEAIAAADFDNDSYIDIAIAHRNSLFILVYVNDGNANFTVMDTVESYDMREIFSADLNGDGFNDIMGGNQYFFNNGDSTFSLAFEDTLGWSTRDICADDFNGDDIIDIVYAENYINTGIFIFWGQGGGSFSPRDTLILGNANSDLVSDDFNNDGNPDLLYMNSDGVFTLLNDGYGNFTSVAIEGVAMHGLETTDLNNDGIVDIVGIGRYSCVGVPRYMLGTGDGNFEPIRTAFDIAGLLSTNTVCPADFNSDGFSDLVICGDTSLVFCGYNDGLLNFENFIDELPYGYTGASCVASADLDNDGDMDMIITNSDNNLTIVLSLASAHSNRMLVPDDIPTIGEAIDYAWNLDTIIVQPGSYQELIDFGGKNLVLASQFINTGDESYIESTILDGGGLGTVLTFNDGEDYRSVIMGFTIQNGSAPSYGGGIFCYDVASPTIVYNIIKDNISAYAGGGLLAATYSASVISNNVIYNNSCGTWGGGMFISSPNATVINNVIFGNSADNNGGGIHLGFIQPVVMNNIIWGNSSPGADIQVGHFGDVDPVLTFCDIQGGYEGQGNVDTDPLFRDPGDGDFHLMAADCGDPQNSPCIDIGCPENEDAIMGCDFGLGEMSCDMGAYGGGNEVMVDIDENDEPLPIFQYLSQNYPNPFNASTTIAYTLSQTAYVRVEIYDLLGRKVESLDYGQQEVGEYRIVWNANGKPSGIYFYRIKADDYSETRKMVLLK